ncbi:MAG: hypothetical protein PHW63_10690 [Alphaproteobacteria bacterium]|nr:hypothetical protein [Alphaproteobacteria bacterium]
MKTERSRGIIQTVALAQCTFNQPLAAIAAYDQFLRQDFVKSNPNKAFLIIVDDTPYVNLATIKYEEIAKQDDRVFYFHIPVRPDHLNAIDTKEAIKRFPKAYRWLRDPEMRALYDESIPSTHETKLCYLQQPDVSQVLALKGRKAYNAMLAEAGVKRRNGDPISPIDWERAVNQVFDHQTGIYPALRRPLLASKRLMAIRLAEKLDVDMLAHLDDDWLRANWIDSQIKALKHADITGKAHYPVFIQTDEMNAPVWAVANLRQTGVGHIIGFNGKQAQGEINEPQEVQGWSIAHRMGNALPKGFSLPEIPPVTFGEDYIFLKRARELDLVVKRQTDFSDAGVRGIFGSSNSDNIVSKVLSPDNALLPPPDEQKAIQNYFLRLRSDFVFAQKKARMPSGKRPHLSSRLLEMPSGAQ